MSLAIVQPTALPVHEDNPLAARQGIDALRAKVEGVRRVLAAPAALPEARARAKEELAAIAVAALQLREQV